MAGKTDAVDGTLFNVLRRKGQDPTNRPVVDAVNAYTRKAQGPVAANDVREVAIKAARDELILEGKQNPSQDQVNAKAYLGVAIAGVEHPFTLAEDQRSPAKVDHYFMSGAISAKVASWLPFLPESLRHDVGFAVSHVIGVLKEVADKIKGTGFNRDDIATDDAGSRSSLKG